MPGIRRSTWIANSPAKGKQMVDYVKSSVEDHLNGNRGTKRAKYRPNGLVDQQDAMHTPLPLQGLLSAGKQVDCSDWWS